MDDGVRAELAALRSSEADQERKEADAFQAAQRRLKQFVEEMRRHDISPMPLVQPRAYQVPGRPGSLFRKAEPSTGKTRYEIVDYGWPIGFPTDTDNAGPAGHLREPAVLMNGEIWMFYWNEFTESANQIGVDPRALLYPQIVPTAYPIPK
jgi:hypothetical protein